MSILHEDRSWSSTQVRAEAATSEESHPDRSNFKVWFDWGLQIAPIETRPEGLLISVNNLAIVDSIKRRCIGDSHSYIVWSVFVDLQTSSCLFLLSPIFLSKDDVAVRGRTLHQSSWMRQDVGIAQAWQQRLYDSFICLVLAVLEWSSEEFQW